MKLTLDVIALFAVLGITNGAISLHTLCQTKFGQNRLGSRCNPYLPPCNVSEWSEWVQSPTQLEIDTSCHPSRARGIQERKRTATAFGPNCPSLSETRKTDQCLNITTVSAVNALRLYAALGSSFKPAASASPVSFFSASKSLFRSTMHKTASAPKATSSVHKIVEEAKKLLSIGLAGGRVKRSSSESKDDCNCSCTSGLWQQQRDLVVVFDSSGSISPHDFRKAIDALIKLLTNLCHFNGSCIRKDITRLALVAYSSRVRVMANFETFANHHATPRKLETLIKSIPHFRGLTYTGEALQKVKSEILNEAAGMREISKRTILVLTDGKSNGFINPGSVSKQIVSEFRGINIVGLGIGQNVNVTELKSITHHSSGLGNILFTGFHNFVEIVEAITTLSGECRYFKAHEVFDKRK